MILTTGSGQYTGADPGGAHEAPSLKLEKIRFFGVKSWFFSRNTPKIFAPPFVRRNFFKCAPPNLKSWIRPCIVSDDEVGIFYKKKKSYILGQWWVLQFCVDDAAPEHWAPPCCGDGFVQDLNFCCVPPPQVTVHVFHDDHEVYPPSTEIDRLSLEKHHIID